MLQQQPDTIKLEALGRRLKRASDDDVYSCPFCPSRAGSPDTEGHLYVHRTRRIFHCFRCNTSGRVLHEREETPAPQQIIEDLKEAKEVILPPRSNDLIPQYLKQPQPKDWYVADGGLVMPIYFNERFVAFQKRHFVRKPKYLTEGRKGIYLYNYDIVTKYSVKFAIVVEGIFDACTLSPWAVSTFGTGISKRQLELLLAAFDTIVFLLDSDATQQAAKLAFEMQQTGKMALFGKILGDKLSPYKLGRQACFNIPLADPVTLRETTISQFIDPETPIIYEEVIDGEIRTTKLS